MIYIDSNIFIYAFSNVDVLGVNSSSVLDAVVRKKITAITSYITFDEVFWKLKNKIGREKALEYTQNFLQIPNLTFVAVDTEIVSKAYDLLKKYPLDPRDALHAATALLANATTIITEDNDFEQIKEITRTRCSELF